MALNDIMFNLNRWHEEKMAGVKAIGLNIAAKAEKEAKIKAPWQPVGKPKRPSKFTGHARDSLEGNAFWESPTSFKITLGSDIEYMVYLELAMDRKYAILEKTLNSLRGEAWRNIKLIMDK